MSSASPDRRVLIAAADLVFHASLEAVVRQAGWEPVRDGAATLAIVELGDRAALDRVRALRGEGVEVLAFGPHVHAAMLDAARELGAVAVPNARIARAVRERLAAR